MRMVKGLINSILISFYYFITFIILFPSVFCINGIMAKIIFCFKDCDSFLHSTFAYIMKMENRVSFVG